MFICLQKVEALLTELYDTKEKFFSADKREKERRLAEQRAAVLAALSELPEGASPPALVSVARA